MHGSRSTRLFHRVGRRSAPSVRPVFLRVSELSFEAATLASRRGRQCRPRARHDDQTVSLTGRSPLSAPYRQASTYLVGGGIDQNEAACLPAGDARTQAHDGRRGYWSPTQDCCCAVFAEPMVGESRTIEFPCRRVARRGGTNRMRQSQSLASRKLAYPASQPLR